MEATQTGDVHEMDQQCPIVLMLFIIPPTTCSTIYDKSSQFSAGDQPIHHNLSEYTISCTLSQGYETRWSIGHIVYSVSAHVILNGSIVNSRNIEGAWVVRRNRPSTLFSGLLETIYPILSKSGTLYPQNHHPPCTPTSKPCTLCPRNHVHP